MFKNYEEPQSLGNWFHCHVLYILRCHFIVYKSTDHRKLPVELFFYNNMEKYWRYWLYFPSRKRERYL